MLKKRILPLDTGSSDPLGRALRNETALLWAQLRTIAGPEGEKGLRVGFVSPVTGGHEKAVAANLAVLLSRRGRRVALLESLQGRSGLAKHLGVSDEVELSALMRGESSIALMPRALMNPGFLFASGAASIDELSQLDIEHQFGRLLGSLEAVVDATILIAPPLFESPDSATFLEWMDTNVLVFAADRTHKREVRRCVKMMAELGIPLAGTVLADVEYHVPSTIARWL
jgi:Mrp family chromosome partitioning ATPase